MRTIFKTEFSRPFLTAFLLLTAAAAAAAQECRTSLTSGGYATTRGTRSSAPPSTQTPAGTKLIANLNLGDVSPQAGRATIVGVIPVKISAGCSYKIEIKRSGSGGGLKPSDIGFGVNNIRAELAGSGRLSGNALSVFVTGQFADDPRNVRIIEGLPRYSATLENVSPSVAGDLLRGPATTGNDSVATPGSSILADLVFVVVPQYFDPSDGGDLALELKIGPAP